MCTTVPPQLCCDMSHHILVIKEQTVRSPWYTEPLSKFSLRGFDSYQPLHTEISRSFLKPSLPPFPHVAEGLFLVTNVGVLGRKGRRIA